MVVSGWLGRNNLARLQLDLRPPEEIYDGVETRIGVRLRNRQRWLPACLLQLELAGGLVRCPLIAGRGRARLSLPITLHGRGLHQLPFLRVSSPFPINFFVRSLALPVNGELLVFPRPRPLGLRWARGAEVAQGNIVVDKGAEGDLTRIHDYRGGEPLKLIHWKISARQDQLKVKELSSMVAAPILIDPMQLPGRSIEEQLGAACWLIKHLIRRGQSIGLQLQKGRILPGCGRQHQRRLLSALAYYGTDTHTS